MSGRWPKASVSVAAPPRRGELVEGACPASTSRADRGFVVDGLAHDCAEAGWARFRRLGQRCAVPRLAWRVPARWRAVYLGEQRRRSSRSGRAAAARERLRGVRGVPFTTAWARTVVRRPGTHAVGHGPPSSPPASGCRVPQDSHRDSVATGLRASDEHATGDQWRASPLAASHEETVVAACEVPARDPVACPSQTARSFGGASGRWTIGWLVCAAGWVLLARGQLIFGVGWACDGDRWPGRQRERCVEDRGEALVAFRAGRDRSGSVCVRRAPGGVRDCAGLYRRWVVARGGVCAEQPSGGRCTRIAARRHRFSRSGPHDG